MVLRLFIFAAAYGRYILVAGLIAGFGFPGAAAILKNFLPQMVALLLFSPHFGLDIKRSYLVSESITAIHSSDSQLILPLLALGIFSYLEFLFYLCYCFSFNPCGPINHRCSKLLNSFGCSTRTNFSSLDIGNSPFTHNGNSHFLGYPRTRWTRIRFFSFCLPFGNNNLCCLEWLFTSRANLAKD